MVVVRTASGQQVRVLAEIADTAEKRRLGLMYRRRLEDGKGMLFLFPREERLVFWMKNTPLSLDIVFINARRRIVHIAERATPYSERRLGSKEPARYVLEVPGGFCQRWGIAVGDEVEFFLPADG
jgi:hypothetical protein